MFASMYAFMYAYMYVCIQIITEQYNFFCFSQWVAESVDYDSNEISGKVCDGEYRQW